MGRLIQMGISTFNSATCMYEFFSHVREHEGLAINGGRTFFDGNVYIISGCGGRWVKYTKWTLSPGIQGQVTQHIQETIGANYSPHTMNEDRDEHIIFFNE